MTQNAISLFLILLPLVSFLYASVGHGGASGYLALMSMFLFPVDTMKQTALVLNLFVSAVAFFQYYRGGHFKFSIFWPLAISSIPAAFIGGTIPIEPVIYKKILGIFLLIAIFRLIWKGNSNEFKKKKMNIFLAVFIGAIIGFLSGLIGIGGGILLTPILLFLGWANIKEAAAVSALFIWVNSAAGLAGQSLNGFHFTKFTVIMVVLAIIGATLGSYFGSLKWKNKRLELFLALVLLVASFKLIF